MATTDGERCVASLSLLVLFCLSPGNSRFIFNLKRCRSCSSRADVPCHLQLMSHQCLHGVTADLLQDRRTWPGPVRDLHAETVKENGTQFANFTWKPPYDSSIESLKGFEIHLTLQEDASLANLCFFANITSNNWTKATDRYDVMFHFDCIQSKKALIINAFINSTPKPLNNISRKSIKHTMNDIPIWWPTLRYTLLDRGSNKSIVVLFDNLFPGATYHEILLVEEIPMKRLRGHKTLDSVLLKVPLQNVTFHNVPCGQNLSIWIRPLNQDKLELHNYKALKDIYTYDCPQPLAVTKKPTAKSNLGAFICIPIILVIVAIVTTIFFFRRDRLKTCELSCLMHNYHQTDQNDAPQNNTADGVAEVMVVPIYYPENKQMVNIVQSLRKVFQKIHSAKVRILSDDSSKMFCNEWLDQTSPYEILIIHTENLQRVYHAVTNGQNGFSVENHNSMKDCISALKVLNKLSGKSSSFKQPHFLSLFDEVDKTFTRNFSYSAMREAKPSYVLSEMVDGGPDKGIQCVLRKEDIVSLLADILNEEIRFDENCLNDLKTPETALLERQLLQVFTYDEDGLREEGADNLQNYHTENHANHLPCHIDLRNEPVVHYKANGHARIVTQHANACVDHHFTPTHYQKLHIYRNGNAQMESLHSKALDKRGIYCRDKFDLQRYECQREEEVPFMDGASNFIPPSDTESLDNVSLCQEMFDINQRNLPTFTTVS